MGCDDACNTGLSLGLGFPETPYHNQDMKKPYQNWDRIFPSLTLGPSDSEETRHVAMKMEDDKGNEELFMIDQKPSSLCAVSTFSNPNFKRKRDLAIHEEAERLFSKVSDEDEEASPRKKLRLTKDQAAILEESFKEHSTLTPKQKQGLAKQLNLSPRQVEVWFQNRRARTKLKQTEEDCEVLKRCCEKLTEENKKLQKELEDLKSMELTRPSHYTQFPAATLTLCPACEIRINGRGDGPSINNNKPYSVEQKYVLYDSSSHQSAAF